MTPEICPNCGAEVPTHARTCPECGADEETGWSERARYEAMGIPDEDSFDYNEFVRREFEGAKPKRRFQLIWVIVAAVLALLFVLGFLLGFFP